MTLRWLRRKTGRTIAKKGGRVWKQDDGTIAFDSEEEYETVLQYRTAHDGGKEKWIDVPTVKEET